jgi:filamentous hemagglutinin family protein
MQNYSFLCLKPFPLALLGSILSMGLSPGAIAQVVPDATLPRASVVHRRGVNTVIQGGTRAGQNLFHSFRDFSVTEGEIASFQQIDPAIANIITRVTGSSASRINGAIEVLQANGAISSANFFLINPQGIHLGRNAALRMNGSFLATTASVMGFADGFEFRANGTQSSALLTVNVPTGLQFGQNPGGIYHQSRSNLTLDSGVEDVLSGGLQVPVGKSIALIGGEIDLTGGVLFAPGGQIELGSVGRFGRVRFSTAGWQFSYPQISAMQTIRLSEGAIVSTSGRGGGQIHLQAQQIDLTGASSITSITRSDRAGQAIILQSQRLHLADRASIRTVSLGSGRSGDVTIATAQFRATSGAQVSVGAANTGDGGNLTLQASESVVLRGSSLFQTGGNLFIRGTGLFSQSNPTATGEGGTIRLSTPSLQLQEGAQISASTFGVGNAGAIQISAEAVDLSGVALDAEGEVILTADGRPYPSGMFAATRRLDETMIPSGNGGNLWVETDRLTLRGGAALKTNTEGSGAAGNLIIRAADFVEVAGSAGDNLPPTLILAASGGIPQIERSGVRDAIGRGGILSIETSDLRVLAGGAIAVGSSNPNRAVPGAGTLSIQAQTVQLQDRSRLLTTTASGNGGTLHLQAENLLLLRHNSSISTTAGLANQGGNGGNLTIAADFVVTHPLENSDLTANAFTGSGGNITITTQGLVGIAPRSQLTGLSDITASSLLGIDGTIQINAPDIDPSRGLTDLPTTPVDAAALIASECVAASVGPEQEQGAFVVTGQGGVPSPSLSVSQLWEDMRPPAETADQAGRAGDRSAVSRAVMPQVSSSRGLPPAIVEAQGWIQDHTGKIVLMANVPAMTPYSSWQTPATCQTRRD